MSRLNEMIINLKQQKVISDPLRTRIIAILYETPMTSKQTADKLAKNPGTIYYHIQQLFKNDILEVDHVDINKGIVEKYYRAKAMLFKLDESNRDKQEGLAAGSSSYAIMSKELVEQMNRDVQELYFKYHQLSLKEEGEQQSYVMEFSAKIFKSEDGENG
ncbi:hypothetical protein JCM19046_2378 [Bacillus sp. JCM 19046]|nr:hypothetical protein JCM19045_1799 [Bacillus sp. JCM 19045]GAF17847.1 hypothetical protein JCM19046_2378 [Bacillus sp. JCM 19046]